MCTVCVCIKACTHLSLSVYSILHARLHSSQPVCRHRNTGQLSEYPPADTGTPPTSLILLTSSHSPRPPPLVFSPFSPHFLLQACLWRGLPSALLMQAFVGSKGQACYAERRLWYRGDAIVSESAQYGLWWSTAYHTYITRPSST